MTDSPPSTAPGLPGDRAGGPLLDKISRLLAKAESTDSAAEAEALVAKAQQLATAHAIDLAAARARHTDRTRRQLPEQRTVAVGLRGKRGLRHLVQLFVVTAAPNDVRVDAARDNSHVVLYGFTGDLDVVERLWSSLSVQLVAGAQRRLAAGEHQTAGPGRTAVAASSWRVGHAEGFVAAVAARLQAARAAAVRAADSDAAAGGAQAVGGAATGGARQAAELVLREKGAEVADFQAATSDARGSWRGWRGAAVPARARAAGHADGTRARLGGEQALPGRRQELAG